MDAGNTPKAELHLHVDGLLNPSILRKLPASNDIELLASHLGELCPVKDFTDWAEKYNPVVYPFVTDKGEFLLQVLARHLIELKQQHVIYVEVMLSSFTFQYPDTERQIALYQQYRDVADRIGGTDLQIEFLIAIGRTTDRAKMERRLQRILEVAKGGLICGVAVAGLEEPNTIRPYQDIFNEFRKAGLGIEIHAGEWKGPEFIWEALQYGYAKRIGHGLAAFDDPLLVKHIREQNIHLEFCPTSNTLLTKYKQIADHPIKRALEHELSFSVNTDDPGPFGTDMDHEYDIVQKAFHLETADFKKILADTLIAAFGKVKHGIQLTNR